MESFCYYYMRENQKQSAVLLFHWQLPYLYSENWHSCSCFNCLKPQLITGLDLSCILGNDRFITYLLTLQQFFKTCVLVKNPIWIILTLTVSTEVSLLNIFFLFFSSAWPSESRAESSIVNCHLKKCIQNYLNFQLFYYPRI